MLQRLSHGHSDDSSADSDPKYNHYATQSLASEFCSKLDITKKKLLDILYALQASFFFQSLWLLYVAARQGRENISPPVQGEHTLRLDIYDHHYDWGHWAASLSIWVAMHILVVLL